MHAAVAGVRQSACGVNTAGTIETTTRSKFIVARTAAADAKVELTEQIG